MLNLDANWSLLGTWFQIDWYGEKSQFYLNSYLDNASNFHPKQVSVIVLEIYSI